MKNRFTIACLLLVTCAVVFAEERISVLTFDDDSQECVPYCCVRMKKNAIGTLTDSIGVLSIKNTEKYRGDTIVFQVIGYEPKCVAFDSIASVCGDTVRITMTKKLYALGEVDVLPPRKTKRIKKGKKHSGAGLLNLKYSEKKGATYGFEVNGKNRRTWLEAMGFFCQENPNMLSSMKFRINIYDASRVKGSTTSDFILVQNEPVYVDYAKSMVHDGKFIHTFSDPILLPEKALVEIEFLENFKGEYIYARGNVVGSGIWTGDPKGGWEKLPISVPFFIQCIQEK